MLSKQLRTFCLLKDIGPLFEHCQYHDRKSGTDVYIHVCIHEHVHCKCQSGTIHALFIYINRYLHKRQWQSNMDIHVVYLLIFIPNIHAIHIGTA